MDTIERPKVKRGVGQVRGAKNPYRVGMSIEELPYMSTIREAAAFMRVGAGVCYQAAKDGKLPVTRVAGQYRVMKPQLLDFLENGGFGAKMKGDK